MKVKSTLRKLNFLLGDGELSELKKKTASFVSLLKSELKKKRIDAEVFVGGSFGKGTLTRSEGYDVDVFVRFDRKHKDLSKLLAKALKGFEKKVKLKVKKVHGSRDYYKFGGGGLEFEVVPVLRIKKIKEAENVTDHSYFHVNYVRRNAKNLREISLAKKFCKAQGVYGAESYIQGFSGYALECLIIYYGSFERMIRSLVKARAEKLIIDPKKYYKRKKDVLVELNESKLNSPIILIDPTWKDRNVLAALSAETFRKFQKAAGKFLARPGERFFHKGKFDVEKLKKKGEFVHVVLETNRQAGDIAGTKMKKYSRFLVRNLEDYFVVLGSEFVYEGGQRGDFYVVVKSRGEIIRRGPSL